MNTDQIEILRRRLRRRVRRLMAAPAPHFRYGMLRFCRFLQAHPLLASLIRELRAKYPTAQTKALHVIHMEQYRPEFAVADTEEENAARSACLLEVMGNDVGAFNDLNKIGERAFNDQPGQPDYLRNFKAEIFLPLLDYLDEKLEEQQFVLALLLRYKKRCEWFNRGQLFRYVTKERERLNEGRKYAQIESVLKVDLYRYLHDQGTSFDIEPYSHRGRIDLLLAQTGNHRVLIEAKVFDNAGRGKRYIQEGFQQVFTYAQQYNSSSAYLAVYNIHGSPLTFAGDDAAQGVPYVKHHHVTIYLVSIDICKHRTGVSERGKLRPTMLNRSDLIRET